jgi:hypothetical protein
MHKQLKSDWLACPGANRGNREGDHSRQFRFERLEPTYSNPRMSPNYRQPPPYEEVVQPRIRRYDGPTAITPLISPPHPDYCGCQACTARTEAKHRRHMDKAICLLATVTVISILLVALVCTVPEAYRMIDGLYTPERMRREREAHTQDLKQWAEEKREAQLRRERWEEEKRREEQERKERIPKMNLFWRDLTPAPFCKAYDAKEYSAVFGGLTNEDVWNGIMWCKTGLPIEINGQRFERPDRCERNVGCGSCLNKFVNSSAHYGL